MQIMDMMMTLSRNYVFSFNFILMFMYNFSNFIDELIKNKDE